MNINQRKQKENYSVKFSKFVLVSRINTADIFSAVLD